MTATTYGAARADADSERRFPLAPAEGWTTVGLALLLGLTLAWSIDDASWVLGRRGLTDFLAWAIGLGVGWGFLERQGRLVALAGPSPGRDHGRAHPVDHRRIHPRPGGGRAGRVVPGDRRVGRRRVPGPGLPRAPVHGPARPLPARPGAPVLGDRSVRRLRGLPPPAPAQRGDRDRAGARGQHVADDPRPAAVPGHLHPRRAVPAHPLPRPRRADPLDPSPDRRCRPRSAGSTCAAGRCSSRAR